jgi:hypothetical protein
MKSQLKFSQVLMAIGTVFMVLALLLMPTATPVSYAQGNPTATPDLSDAGDNPTPSSNVTQPKGGGGKFSLPPTLDELIAQNPELKTYLDKVKDVQVGDFDFSELYTVLAGIYDKEGLAGVIIFLQDSGLLEKLGLPPEYIDLLLMLDKGETGRDAAIEAARTLGLISDADELLGFLTIETDEKVEAAKTEILGLGVSAYEYNADTGELAIGIPLALIEGVQTPGELFSLFAKVATVDGVTGFRVPKPNLTAPK